MAFIGQLTNVYVRYNRSRLKVRLKRSSNLQINRQQTKDHKPQTTDQQQTMTL